MLNEAQTLRPQNVSLTGQSLATLLALVGAEHLDAETLRSKMKLDDEGFNSLIRWLETEGLVEIVIKFREGTYHSVSLTGRGERLLLSLLEQMCELPEFHRTGP